VSWALLVAVLALLFTVASFWWLNARRGSLEVGQPGAYAFANKPRLRLPIVFYNTGARALMVTDLRLLLVDADQPPLHWIATTSQLRPQSTNERDFATPFAVPGRGTREFVFEFGHEQGWSPELDSKHRMRLHHLPQRHVGGALGPLVVLRLEYSSSLSRTSGRATVIRPTFYTPGWLRRSICDLFLGTRVEQNVAGQFRDSGLASEMTAVGHAVRVAVSARRAPSGRTDR
jgi:hypothetical protein